MADPLVSIIVPVYKTPVDLLRRFLRSALSQTLSEIELISVDDASPDECPTILDDVAADDDRMTVLHRSTNGRAGVARGDGLRLATGDYVLFADADDVMQPDMCETLYRLARKHDADIVSCSWTINDQDGNLVGRGYLTNRSYDLTSSRQRAKAYRSLNYALWNKIFRREVIAPIRFERFEANIGEDTLFNIAALCRSRTMVTTAYQGYDYSTHAASATGRSSKGMPYLRTLVESGERIEQTLATADGSIVGKKYADRVALNRFTTGCGWIAEQTDAAERSSMWAYWRRHLGECLIPNLEAHRVLAAWYRIATAMGNAKTTYRLTRLALWLTDPLGLADRIEARRAEIPNIKSQVPNKFQISNLK